MSEPSQTQKRCVECGGTVRFSVRKGKWGMCKCDERKRKALVERERMLSRVYQGNPFPAKPWSNR